MAVGWAHEHSAGIQLHADIPKTGLLVVLCGLAIMPLGNSFPVGILQISPAIVVRF